MVDIAYRALLLGRGVGRSLAIGLFSMILISVSALDAHDSAVFPTKASQVICVESESVQSSALLYSM